MKGRLQDRVGLVVGIANEKSLAAGSARAYDEDGAQLACTYLNAKAQPYVERAVAPIEGARLLPFDARDPEGAQRIVCETVEQFGRLDFLLHAIAYCPADDLNGPILGCSREGLADAIQVTCHSLIELARAAIPMMPQGGSITTISYAGAEKALRDYNIMGPVKAALEGIVRGLAAELGPRGIRVNAISAGPVPTRAASGLSSFEGTLERAARAAPMRRLVTPDEVGAFAAFLASDAAAGMTGDTYHVDGGLHALGWDHG
ncbi:MAG: SDR family oxidoreductase [Pseudomonadota bacterium]